MATTSQQQPRLARLRQDDYRLNPSIMARMMTPALVVYEEKVQQNIQSMLAYTGGDPDRWRPHLKTTKIPEVYAMLVDAGLRAFKCATVREARCMLEVLKQRGVSDADLLIAYPLQGPSMTCAAALAEEFPATTLSVLSEDPEHARDTPPTLGIFLDVNPGMHRTGIPLDDIERLKRVASVAGERLRGLHFYDGHIHQEDAQERRTAAQDLYRRLIALVSAMVADSVDIGEIITSGTPSFRYALEFPGFGDGGSKSGRIRHRISPGTVVFHDFQYDELLEDLDLIPAAVIVARVVSHPRPGIVTCDAGSKSIAAECGNPVGFAIGHPEMVGLAPSEEHLPFDVSGVSGPVPALGSVLYLVPRHICPSVNLAEQALLVRGDGSARAVDVAGRAHELLLQPDALSA